jgi:hypothetical protein
MSNGKEATKKRKPRKKPAAKPAVEAAPVERPNYTMAEWHEKEMFQCTRCPWSTLNEDEMVRHVAKHLSSTHPSVIRTDTGFVTPAGDKIIREEAVEKTEEVNDGTHETHTG